MEHLIYQIGWMALVCLQISISIYFIYLYKVDKDQRKLMFSIAFLTGVFPILFRAVGISGLDNEILFLRNIYYWSTIPFLIAFFSIAHFSLLKPKKFTPFFYSFIVFTISSFIIIGLYPSPANQIFSPILGLAGLEILIVAVFIVITKRNVSDFVFLIAVLSFNIGGSGESLGINQSFQLFAFFIGYILFTLIFIFPSSVEQKRKGGMSEFFSLKKQLLETTKTFDTLVHQMTDGIFIMDKKGKLLEISEKFCQQLGYQRKELININILTSSLLDNEGQKKLTKNIRLRAMGKKLPPYEITIYHNSGKPFPFEIQTDKIRFKNDTVFMAIVRDIKLRKEVEEELVTSEERYRKLFNSSKDAIMTLEPPDWKFTSGNPAILDVFGLQSIEEFVQYEPWALSPEFQKDGRKSMEKAAEMINIAVEQGSNFFEWTHKKISGEEFPATILLTKVKLEDKIIIQATVKDITEQKKAEKQIEEAQRILTQINKDLERKVDEKTNELSCQNQELNAMNQELTATNEELLSAQEKLHNHIQTVNELVKQKDEFIHMLGHDLKNPLTLFFTLLPIVQEKSTDPENQEIIGKIIQNAKRMREIIDETLKLARLNDVGRTLKLEQIRLIDIINETLEHHVSFLDKYDIEIINNISEELVVQVDRFQFEELLSNLISNAVKYTGTNDKGIITMNGMEKEGKIQCSFTDNGIGMTSNQIEHAFDKFYKAGTPREGLTSNGLGLAICENIIQKHHGKIWVESEGLGKGSTFYFTLPKTKN